MNEADVVIAIDCRGLANLLNSYTERKENTAASAPKSNSGTRPRSNVIRSFAPAKPRMRERTEPIRPGRMVEPLSLLAPHIRPRSRYRTGVASTKPCVLADQPGKIHDKRDPFRPSPRCRPAPRARARHGRATSPPNSSICFILTALSGLVQQSVRGCAHHSADRPEPCLTEICSRRPGYPEHAEDCCCGKR